MGKMTVLSAENLVRDEFPGDLASLPAFPCNGVEVGPVEVLLAGGSPAAVARFVRSIVVDPIKRRSCRTFTHVQKECLEGVPLLADRDASATVQVVSRCLRVQASLAHAVPRAVGARRRSAGMCMAVLPPSLSASTRTCLATRQIRRGNRFDGSTFAVTDPGATAFGGSSRAEYGKPAKLAASQIDWSHGDSLPSPRIIFSDD